MAVWIWFVFSNGSLLCLLPKNSWGLISLRRSTAATLCDASRTRKRLRRRSEGRRKKLGGTTPQSPCRRFCSPHCPATAACLHSGGHRLFFFFFLLLCCRFEAKKRWETKSNMGFMWQKKKSCWHSHIIYVMFISFFIWQTDLFPLILCILYSKACWQCEEVGGRKSHTAGSGENPFQRAWEREEIIEHSN